MTEPKPPTAAELARWERLLATAGPWHEADLALAAAARKHWLRCIEEVRRLRQTCADATALFGPADGWKEESDEYRVLTAMEQAGCVLHADRTKQLTELLIRYRADHDRQWRETLEERGATGSKCQCSICTEAARAAGGER